MPGAAADLSLAHAIGGTGAGGKFGIGGLGASPVPGPGLPGTGFGSGGGGAVSDTVSQAGGNGAPGIVIIDEFA
jgi:hypothetical protein